MIRKLDGFLFAAAFDDIWHIVPADAVFGTRITASCGATESWPQMGATIEENKRACPGCFAAHTLPTHEVTITLVGEQPEVLPVADF